MKQPYIGNTKINKLYKGNELWCNWSSGGGGESGNNQYLIYSFTNFDVDNSIANKKIYSDNNNNVYLEIIGNATNLLLTKSSNGNLITNGTLKLNVECKEIIKDNFTIELTLRLINLNSIPKKIFFQCISAVKPFDGFKVMLINKNSLNLLSFVDNIDINKNETIKMNDVLKLKLTKGNNELKLYKNDSLSINTTCKANWENSKNLCIGANASNTDLVLGTYEFISLYIYNREV